MPRNNTNVELLKAHRSEILDILARRGFHSPRVFGSTAAGGDRPGSDIDLLVTSDGDLDLLELAGAREELEALLGVQVDLATEEILKPKVAARAAQEAVPI